MNDTPEGGASDAASSEDSLDGQAFDTDAQASDTDAASAGDAQSNEDAMTASDAASLDAGDSGDANSLADATDVDAVAVDAAPSSPVVDLGQSGFLAYGQLKVTFDRAVAADTLSVAISPARPANLAVTSVAQAGSDHSVMISLNTYHLPLDYKLTLESATFSIEATIPGVGNGSRTLFTSSHMGNGDLRTWMAETASAGSGRAAGDMICQSEADAAGLKGTFRAFLSSDEAADPYDAACRMLDRAGLWDDDCGLAQAPADEAPLIDQGGLPVVNGASGVASGEWLSTIRYRADGVAASGHVWTGSDRTGRSAGSNADCLGFVDSGTTPRAVATADPTLYLPDFYYSFACSDAQHLVCVQVGTGFFPTSTLHQRTGKAVFVTNDGFAYPSTGSPLSDADTFCQDAAKNAGYGSFANFIAWMSDASDYAPCRLVASGGIIGADHCGLGSWPDTGPWVRRDGFVVAENITQLLSGRIAAPLLYSGDGTFLDKSVWTVTNTWNNGTLAGACSGGIATGVGAWSLYYSPRSCSSQQPLVCFER